MFSNSAQTQTKLSVKSLRIFAIAFLAIVLTALGTFAISASAQSNTNQDGASLSAARVDVSIVDSGSRSTAQRSLERESYNVGDNLVLKWKGATVSDTDFVVPTQIKYGTKTISVNSLVLVNQVQDNNSEYSRRMGTAGNMATFAKVKTYVEQEHSVDLGLVITGNETVTITWQRLKPVYRLYNMITSEHLFTTNKTEYDKFENLSKTDGDAWIGEGISWLAPENGETVYRFYNAGLGAMGHSSHYYSKDATEIATLEKSGWTNDGAENGFPSGGSTAIWTCYNEGLGSAHHYTSSKTEWSGLNQHGWALEEDKNGTNGVFQGALALSWTYADNYYKVNHVVGDVTYTEWKEGKAGSQTNAIALDYPGYTAGTVTNVNIAANNSTSVTITYSPNVSTVKFDTNGGSDVASQSVSFGAKITVPENPTKDNYEFNGWSLDEAGEYKVDLATYTMPAGNLTLYAQWKDPSVTTYEIVLHSNKQPSTGEEVTVTRTPGDGLQLGAIDEDGKVTGNPFSWTQGTTVHGFKYWNTKADGSGDTYFDRHVGDLSTTAGTTVNLYAQWTNTDLNPFWIAPASKITTGNSENYANVVNPDYTNPETGVVKVGNEIESDIRELRKGAQGSESYQELYNTYKYWMTTDSYHLYAKISGATGDDAYVEFRLVNLLSHESTGNKSDGTKYDDGTVFTIQAIHAMPLAYRMHSSIASNEGGWAQTDLRENMNSDNILKYFNPGLTDQVRDVQKWNRYGQGDSEKVTSTNDKLWVMSYTELCGEAYTSWGTKVKAEGDQYDYWKNIPISNFQGTNEALQGLTKTRSGVTPAGSLGGSWLRSAFPSNSSQFGVISAIGGPGTAEDANIARGLVPCLAVGTINYTVTFNTDGGSAVDSQSVPSGGFAEVPDQTPTSATEGYVFEGWYKDSGKTTKFDFETEEITADTTIYAKYVAGESTYSVEIYHETDEVGVYPESYSDKITGTGITDAQTDAKATVTAAGLPEGYEIDTVEDVQIKGDGSAVAKAMLKRSTFTIKFDKNGRTITKFPEDVKQRYNTVVSDPTPTPEAEGYNFIGWYRDSDGTTAFTPGLDRMPASDITLYAKWEESNKIGYNVEHYLQNADGTWPTSAASTVRHQGEADTTTNYEDVKLSPIGFSINPDASTSDTEHKTNNVTINSDGSSTLKIYYFRNQITVKFIDAKTGTDVELEAEEKLKSQYFGSTLQVPANQSAEGMIFNGWLLNDPDSDVGVAVTSDTTVPNVTELKVYCNWTLKGYFLAAASSITTGNTTDKVNQANSDYTGTPTGCIKKTATEIDKDLAVLRGEDKLSENYTKTKKEYEDYMNNDNVHLYAAWIGNTTDSSGTEQRDNRYLEFRIIQVGDHDNDGSVLTFQMTHTIPTAFAISSESSTASGWENSPLREQIKKFGDQYKQVMGNFHTVKKKTMKGGGSADLVETDDDFWIASATEIYGGNASAGAAEGVQYEWFKKVLGNGTTTGKSPDTQESNPALVRLTRAKNKPAGENTYSGFQGKWWTRTPVKDRNNAQVAVNDKGAIWASSSLSTLTPNYASGVVVCFAL